MATGSRGTIDRLRAALDLAPSDEFVTRANRLLIARYSRDGPGGWVLCHHLARRPLAWLQMFDGRTWETVGCTGDEVWAFTPSERHLRPSLAAFAGSSQRVATSSRRRFAGRRFEFVDASMRLNAMFSLRDSWLLRDADGALATVAARGKLAIPDELIFRWHRDLERSALTTLFVAYAVILERYSRMFHAPDGAGGGG